jgi:hypothetical protein
MKPCCSYDTWWRLFARDDMSLAVVPFVVAAPPVELDHGRVLRRGGDGVSFLHN